MKYQHQCIKPSCAKQYNDSDEDDYYCPSCREANKLIAKQIDAKMGVKPKRPVMSEFESFKQGARALDTPTGGKAYFARG